MAQLNDLIVNGYSRFLNSAYGNLNGSATSALCAANAAKAGAASWVSKSDNRNYNVAFSLDNAFNYRNTLTFNPSSNTLSSTNITTVTLSGTTVKGVTVSGTNITAATTVRGANISGTNISGASKTMSIDNLISSATRTIPTVNDKTIKITTGASPATGQFSTNTAAEKTITLGSMALKASGDYSTTTHTHGNMESTFVKTLPNTSSTTWSSQFGVLNSGFWLYSIRAQGTVPAWFAAGYGAGIAFGGGDTKGVVSMDWNTPYIKFASGPGNTSAGEPKWWFGFSGTAGKKYTLPGADSTLVASTGSYSGTNGLTALSARGAYSATNAATAGDSNKLGGTAAGSFALQDGNYSSVGLTAKSARGAYSATNASTAEKAADSDKLGGTAAASFALQDGCYSSYGFLTADSARGAFSASTANYSNSTNTAIKVNSAIYLQDFGDTARYVLVSWGGQDVSSAKIGAGASRNNGTQYLAAFYTNDGSTTSNIGKVKPVDVSHVQVASADTVDGLHVATGTIGSATNYLYFC